MSEHLLRHFPKLRTTAFRVTSPADPTYNCVAWAAGDATTWWWPSGEVEKTFWPEEAPRTSALESFQRVFTMLGYSICADEILEVGVEKIALFLDAEGNVTHAARQLPQGNWTSKLGQSEDIEHELHALEGSLYGRIGLLLKRPRQHG